MNGEWKSKSWTESACKACDDPLILKEGDDYSIIVEGWKRGMVDNPDVARQLVKELVKQSKQTKKKSAESMTEDELYLQGYEDGKRNIKDSILWVKAMYQTGWKDGEGDRLYS
jgi:hypothetical protein